MIVSRVCSNTRGHRLANHLGLSTNCSRVPDPTFGPPCGPLIFKVHGHAERVIKPCSAWAGLTFSRCYDYARDRSERGRSPTTCPRNNRRRSILDNTLIVRSRLEHTRAFVYSEHSTHLTRLTHCRKWKKLAATSRGSDATRFDRTDAFPRS